MRRRRQREHLLLITIRTAVGCGIAVDVVYCIVVVDVWPTRDVVVAAGARSRRDPVDERGRLFRLRIGQRGHLSRRDRGRWIVCDAYELLCVTRGEKRRCVIEVAERQVYGVIDLG